MGPRKAGPHHGRQLAGLETIPLTVRAEVKIMLAMTDLENIRVNHDG